MIKVYLKVDIVRPWNTCPYGVRTPPSISGKKTSTGFIELESKGIYEII
jgi:hypothetical protein